MESPSYFSQILKMDLVDVIFFHKGLSTLLQYVDELLCSSSKEASEQNSISLLKPLAAKVH